MSCFDVMNKFFLSFSLSVFDIFDVFSKPVYNFFGVIHAFI